jgi:hypothetical protein
MKKLVLTAAIFAFGFALNMGTSQVAEAGPFGGQGHWVSLGDEGGEECMMHWWRNDCKVGTTRGGGATVE